MKQPAPLVIGLALVALFSLLAPPLRAADDEALRKEALKLNDVSGEDALDEEVEKLKKDPAQAKKLLAVAATMAKEKEQPFNYNASFIFLGLARELSDVDAASTFFRVCVDQANKLKSDRKKMLAYLPMIALYTQAKKYDEAEKVCKEFLELRLPASQQRVKFIIVDQLIQITALKGNKQEAFKQLEEQKKLRPDDINVMQVEGWLLNFDEKYEQAAKIYEQLIEKLETDDDKDRFRYQLSGMYSELGNIDKATEHLQILLKKEPDSPRYNNDLGYIWADNDKNLDEAEKMIKKAVDKEPNKGAYLDSMGWVLFKKKKHKEAKDWLLKAIQDKEEGQHAEIYDHLGDVHKALNEKVDALSAWKKALELSGNSKRDQKRKEEIEKKIKENQ